MHVVLAVYMQVHACGAYWTVYLQVHACACRIYLQFVMACHERRFILQEKTQMSI